MANKESSHGKVGASRFVASVAAPGEFEDGGPEVAFVGRSNVGKSSLLNALAGRKSLARTSKTPGRTQRANLFDVRFGGQDVRLVDLPGYGHAKAPHEVRSKFGQIIEGWLLGSERLVMAAILVDVRREPDETTMNFLLWLQQHNVPATVVFTKTDKLARNRRKQAMVKLANAYGIGRRWFGTSSTSGDGIAELRADIAKKARKFGASAQKS